MLHHHRILDEAPERAEVEAHSHEGVEYAEVHEHPGMGPASSTPPELPESAYAPDSEPLDGATQDS